MMTSENNVELKKLRSEILQKENYIQYLEHELQILEKFSDEDNDELERLTNIIFFLSVFVTGSGSNSFLPLHWESFVSRDKTARSSGAIGKNARLVKYVKDNPAVFAAVKNILDFGSGPKCIQAEQLKSFLVRVAATLLTLM